ncbi:MAG TPA: DUF2249 domain-containing protein [Gemmatimonadaceae bacterium]|nr:DUF2249 domain-containing protein [Gemmatimonadaceae bacterium]
MNLLRDDLPLALQVVDPAKVVECDVRDDLRRGREPFARLMAARGEVQEGGALRVRAIIEPVPLYTVMSKHGFAHHTVQHAADDWEIWFYRQLPVLDVRRMEPPEPLSYTLAALRELPDGVTLVQVNARVPMMLLPRLTELGFSYDVQKLAEDRVHVYIRRAGSAVAHP